MRRRTQWTSVGLALALGAGLWHFCAAPGDGFAGPHTGEEPTEDAGLPADPPGLARRSTESGDPTPFEAPPAERPGFRRVHLVAVLPPDRAGLDVAFGAAASRAGPSGEPERVALDVHPSARGEAWIEATPDAGLIRVRAQADHGRLVSVEGLEFLSGEAPAELRVPLFAAGQLDATVLDRDGHPIEGAHVRRVTERAIAFASSTDARGKTRLRGLSGEHYLIATAEGYGDSQRRQIVIEPGARVEATFVCARATLVTGRALDDRGHPLTGLLRGALASGDQYDEVVLGKAGSFRLSRLSVGTPGERVRFLVHREGGTSEKGVQVPVASQDGSFALGDLRFETKWSVPLRVVSPRGDELPSVDLQVVPREPGGTLGIPIRCGFSRDGPFDVLLPPGLYLMDIAAPAAPEPVTYHAEAPVSIEVTGPWTGTPVTLVVGDASSLRGRCLVAGAVPPRPRMLLVRSTAPAPAGRLERLVDEQGRFHLTLPDARRGESFEVYAVNVGVLGTFTAPRDASDVVVDLTASRALGLVVRARDTAGHGVPTRWTRWEREPAAAPGWLMGPSADGESVFWPLLPGTYRASVTLWDGTTVQGEPFVLKRDGQVVEVRCGP